MTAASVYYASDAELTKSFYRSLEGRGPLGVVGMNLMRSQKASSRAKVYRGGIRGVGSYKRMAYEKKQWSMDQLCHALETLPVDIRYGWKEDPNVVFGQDPSFVLYIDLPNGQVSFHSPSRGKGPDYPGEWDEKHESEVRILAFCDSVMASTDERQRVMFS